MNKKVMVFAGTNEGREICEFLCENHIETKACVATEYGSFCLEEVKGLTILEGRLDVEEIAQVIKDMDYVIDASHPYAQIISENIIKACESLKDGQQDPPKRMRIVRESYENKGRVFPDFESLCAYINEKEGNVLLTTGSKDLPYFQAINDYENRVFPRVLPAMDSLQKGLELGFKPSNMICMQGPFSKDMNIAMIEKTKAKFVVSKETGSSGGFLEKVEAAKEAGAEFLIVGRPTQEEGLSLEEMKTYFVPKVIQNSSRFPMFVSLENKQILVVGGGMVGTRRVKTLLNFQCNIIVVAPEVSEELKEMIEENQLTYYSEVFEPSYLEHCFMVIGATDNKEVNETIYKLCKEKNILVNICDNPNCCDFYFPAIFQTEDLIGGLVSKDGNKHGLVKNTAKEIRGIL